MVKKFWLLIVTMFVLNGITIFVIRFATGIPYDKDLYKILGVARDANLQGIKKAYRTLALKYHPDKNPGNEKEAEEKFKEMQEAYDILKDEHLRQQYDSGPRDTVFQPSQPEPTEREQPQPEPQPKAQPFSSEETIGVLDEIINMFRSGLTDVLKSDDFLADEFKINLGNGFKEIYYFYLSRGPYSVKEEEFKPKIHELEKELVSGLSLFLRNGTESGKPFFLVKGNKTVPFKEFLRRIKNASLDTNSEAFKKMFPQSKKLIDLSYMFRDDKGGDEFCIKVLDLKDSPSYHLYKLGDKLGKDFAALESVIKSILVFAEYIANGGNFLGEGYRYDFVNGEDINLFEHAWQACFSELQDKVKSSEDDKSAQIKAYLECLNGISQMYQGWTIPNAQADKDDKIRKLNEEILKSVSIDEFDDYGKTLPSSEQRQYNNILKKLKEIN
jgi:curved DNA-binding protein CbpA